MGLLRTTRTSQPQGAVEIDWSNPLTKGLICAQTPFSKTINLAPSGGVIAPNGAIGNVLALRNLSLYSADVNDYYAFTPRQTLTEATIFAVIGGISASLESVIWRTNDTEIDFVPYSDGKFYLNTFASTRYISAVSPPSGFDRSSFTIAARGASAANSHAAFLNGSKIGSTNSSFVVNSSIRLMSGAAAYAPNARAASALNLIWNRALSDAEIKSLSDNPCQLFKPVSRSLWIPGVVSGGGTTSATVTQSDSADTTSLNATVTTGATIASSDGADTQTVVSANWMTAQLASSNGADTQAVAATVGGITNASVSQVNGGDNTAITMANWMTAQSFGVNAADASSVTAVVTTGGSVATAEAADITSVTGNIVGVTSCTVSMSDAADLSAMQTLVTTGATIYGTDGADTALASAACWTTAIMAAVNGADTTNIVGSSPGTAVYPLESQVQAGVQYGPTGADFTGTLTSGSGPSAADIAAAVWSYTQ